MREEFAEWWSAADQAERNAYLRMQQKVFEKIVASGYKIFDISVSDAIRRYEEAVDAVHKLATMNQQIRGTAMIDDETIRRVAREAVIAYLVKGSERTASLHDACLGARAMAEHLETERAALVARVEAAEAEAKQLREALEWYVENEGDEPLPQYGGGNVERN